uniref:Uncharacterized protein n=1 Tax=Romanomermis culicivorax TaxID=13658 RepID=A0A915L0K7_ROMCU
MGAAGSSIPLVCPFPSDIPNGFHSSRALDRQITTMKRSYLDFWYFLLFLLATVPVSNCHTYFSYTPYRKCLVSILVVTEGDVSAPPFQRPHFGAAATAQASSVPSLFGVSPNSA